MPTLRISKPRVSSYRHRLGYEQALVTGCASIPRLEGMTRPVQTNGPKRTSWPAASHRSHHPVPSRGLRRIAPASKGSSACGSLRWSLHRSMNH